MQPFQGRIAIQILKSKLFLWTILPFLITGVLVIVYFSSKADYTIFPNKTGYKYIFYTDASIGGNSQIIERIAKDSILKIDFKLKDSIGSPYVGISVAPKDGSVLDLAYYNQVSIKVRGNNLDNLSIALFTQNTHADIVKQNAELNFYTTHKISAEIGMYVIPIETFTVPDWWNEINNISSAKSIRPNLRQFLRINIGNAYSPNIGETQSLEIYQITFNRNNKSLVLFILALEAIVMVMVFVVLFLIKKFKANTNLVTINYKPVESEARKDPTAGFIGYINNNFQNSQLSIETVSKETGASARKITNYMQTQFACNFKTYINRLRINESKRFLIETDLNIGEVAFKVGFNNQSHFNRVFKAEMNISPTEFRDKARNPK